MGQTEVTVTQPALGHCPVWCSGTHNGCFCEGPLTLAQPFREGPTLMGELSGLTLYIAIVMPLGDH